LKLACKLRFDGKASKIRGVFISKSDGKLRSLGILTMEDRAKQMLMKFALEPEWEARFETNSYGFRPGYSVADAKWCIARQF
jgi:RNA-directed DNA polymerase